MKNKTPHIILAAALLVVLSGAYQSYYRHKEPPPGWKIMCDGQGHYGAKYPDSNYVISEWVQGRGLMTSRQKAINRAWFQYTHEQADKKPARLVIQWQECEK